MPKIKKKINFFKLLFFLLLTSLVLFDFVRLNNYKSVEAAPQTFTVTNTNDSGAGSLRQAIADANGNGNPADQDIIEFDIAGAGTQTISLTSANFSITQPVLIDGYTQSDATPNTAAWPAAMDGTLRIRIEAPDIGVVGGSGTFTITADNTTVQGLIISYSAEGPFRLSNADNVTIKGNYLNTDSSGNAPNLYGGSSWEGFGVMVGGGSDNAQIGGSNPEDRNVITSKHRAIEISGSSHVIRGNNFHVGADGSTDLHSPEHVAIDFYNVTDLEIGGTDPGEGNLIKNANYGILGEPFGSSDGVLIAGNRIVDVAFQPVEVHNTTNVTIGGTTATAGNVLGGGATGLTLRAVDGAEVYGNYIGIDSDGTTPLANDNDGLRVHDSATNVTIGGTDAGEANTIKSNASHGIQIFDETSNISVIGNDLSDNGSNGLTVEGVTNLDVNDNTVERNGTEGMRIRGTNINASLSGNTVNENTNSGIVVHDNQDGITFDDNEITANEAEGVTLYASGDSTFTNNNIADNNSSGILFDCECSSTVGTEGNGNSITGNDSTGVSANNVDSVQITDNTITDSGAEGVLFGDGVTDSSVIGNSITTNTTDGVHITGTANNVAVTGNDLYDNDGLGINHEHNGVNSNDDGDGDSGPNDLLNYPDDVEYEESGGNTEMTYTLDVPAGDYRIEYYSNTAADGSGHGEGETFLDSHNVTISSSDHAVTHTLTGIDIPNIALTVTEIDDSTDSGYGSTSEFGAIAVEAVPEQDLGINITLDNPEDLAQGVTLEYTVTFTNYGPDPVDLSQYTGSSPGVNQLFFVVMPPDITFDGVTSHNDIDCTGFGPGSAGGFGSAMANHSDHEAVNCYSTASSENLLAEDESVTAVITATVANDSDLDFINYVIGNQGIGDPDGEVLSDLGSNDIIDYLTENPINNFAFNNPLADLAIDLELLNPEDVSPGETVNYQVTLTNHGQQSFDLQLLDSSRPSNPAVIAGVFPTVSDLTFDDTNSDNIDCEDLGPGSIGFIGLAGEDHTGTHQLMSCSYIGSSNMLEPNESLVFNLNFTVQENVSDNFEAHALHVSLPTDPDVQALLNAISSATGDILDTTDNENLSTAIYQQGDPDTEGDGVSDSTEDAGPNNGDANDDGTLDSEQANVVSFTNSVTNKPVALEVSDDCSITLVDIDPESSHGEQDPKYTYPLGFIGFELNCADPGYTADVTLFYFDTSDENYVLRKYFPDSDDYQTLSSANISQITIDDSPVITTNFEITDGGPLDLDNEENGEITDPTGLGIESASNNSSGGIGSVIDDILSATGDSRTWLRLLAFVLMTGAAVSVAYTYRRLNNKKIFEAAKQ